MILVPNKVKQDCESDALVYKEFIVIDGREIEIKGEESKTAYKDTTFFGTFNLKMLTFTTENDVNFKQKEFEYYKKVNENSFRIGRYIVTEVKDNDTLEEVTVTAYDYGLKFATTYETSLNYASNTVTLYEVVEEVCGNVGIILKDNEITNGDFIVDSNQFVEGTLNGDVISAVAMISGTFATINEEDELTFILKNETDEIIEDYVELLDKRDTQPITCVAIGNRDIEGENVVLKDQELIDLYGENWLVIQDNPFAYNQDKRVALISPLFNKVKGFTYSSFESNYAFKPYLQLGDSIKFRNKNGDLIDSVVLRIETKYDDLKISAPSIIKATIEYQHPLDALSLAKRTEIIVDKQQQTITSVVSDTNENTSNISTLTQTVNGINLNVSSLSTNVGNLSGQTAQLQIDVNQLRNEIGDVTDITTQEEGQGTLNFESINASEPINMTIRGTVNGDVDLLYPYNVLYPQSTLYPKTRVLRFINTATSEIIDYEIPIDLYYLDAETYDEYTWDFASGVCQTVKKITLDASGDKTVLPAPVTIVHDNPGIYLDDGDYTVTMLGHPYAYMKIRLMSQNMYTSQFATRVELTSAINQSASEINLEVAKKVGNDEVISRINQTAEAIKIEASKIDIQGTLTAINNDTSTTINGNKITTGSITGDKIAANTITASKVSSAIITTTNFSSQNINADRITTGTMTAGAINLGNGTFRVTTGGAVTATSGSIGGWNLTSSGITSGITDSQIYPNGRLRITPSTGGRLNAGSEGFLINGDGGSRPVVISDFITQTPGSGASIGMRAIYGNIRIASSYRASLIGSGDSEVFCDYGIMLNSGGTGKNIYASRVGSTASANMVVTTGGGNPSSKNTKKDFKEITDYEKIYEEFKDLKLYDFKYKYKDISTKENGFGFIIDDLEETKILSRYLTTYDRYGKIEGNNFTETLPEESKFGYKTWDRDDTIQMLFILTKSLQNKIDKLEEQLNEKS